MQLYLVLYQVGLKRLLNKLELILIYLTLIQQGMLRVQKPGWVGRL